MNKVLYIAIDLEGCIIDAFGGEKPLSLEKLQALRIELQNLWFSHKIGFFLNTGRQAPYIELIYLLLGAVDDIPWLAENGSVLYYPASKRWLRHEAITDKALAKFRKVEAVLFEAAIRTNGTVALGKNFSFSIRPPKNIPIDDYFQTIRNEILYFLSSNIISMSHSQSAVDITIKGVDKGTGITFWCKKMNALPRQIAAIGDSRGDLAMLQIIKYPMCPSNATEPVQESVKRAGGYISPYPETEGVIDCINHLKNQLKKEV